MPSGVYEKTEKHKEKMRKNSPFKKGHKINLGRKRPEIKKWLGKFLFKKGNIPWNKGLNGYSTSWKGKNHTEKTKRLQSKTRKKLIKEGKIKIFGNGLIPDRKGEKNPMYGKHHSEKTKRKIKKARAQQVFSKKDRKKMSESAIKYYREHPEAIEEYKEKRKGWISPKKDTSIEVKIQNFLKKLGIEYFTHQYIKIPHGYQCDILIPYLNLVIECDGNYWHKYPVGNDIDHIRTKELLEKGFKVLRLWEFEINEMSINNFKKKLGI